MPAEQRPKQKPKARPRAAQNTRPRPAKKTPGFVRDPVQEDAGAFLEALDLLDAPAAVGVVGETREEGEADFGQRLDAVAEAILQKEAQFQRALDQQRLAVDWDTARLDWDEKARKSGEDLLKVFIDYLALIRGLDYAAATLHDGGGFTEFGENGSAEIGKRWAHRVLDIKLAAYAGQAMGMPAWQIKEAEAALTNRAFGPPPPIAQNQNPNTQTSAEMAALSEQLEMLTGLLRRIIPREELDAPVFGRRAADFDDSAGNAGSSSTGGEDGPRRRQPRQPRKPWTNPFNKPGKR